MALLPRKNITKLEKCQHGGLDYTEIEKLDIPVDEVLDYSSNLNPAGAPPGIELLIKSAELSRYPDSQSIDLKRAIARRTGLSEANVIAGSGSTELIRLAVTAYVGESDKAVIIEPTYGEYRTACEIAGAEVISHTLSIVDNFKPDIAAIVQLIKSVRPKIVFICNPNNPTGGYLSRGEFIQILTAAPDSLIVLDEAYISFVEQSWSSSELLDKGNLLILRSMTKDYAIAGLRLGYALANSEIIQTLNCISPPWNVNAVAQHAGIVALQSEQYIINSRKMISESKQYLISELERLGFHCLPSQANFFLVQVDNANEIRNRLLSQKILVRDCTSFGLPQFIRLAPGTIKKNRHLITTLQEIVEMDKP